METENPYNGNKHGRDFPWILVGGAILGALGTGWLIEDVLPKILQNLDNFYNTDTMPPFPTQNDFSDVFSHIKDSFLPFDGKM